MHQLNPKLNKDKWSVEDNKLLFNLHKTYKSHWKKIAEQFNGRTDNSIKNQFFSVVRKALRKACKVLGNVSNTNTINKIKPKVLSNYLSLDYDIPVKGTSKTSVKVCFNEFVQQFAFSKYHELAKNLREDDLIMIRGCIDYLNNLNDGYMKKKKKISKKSSKKTVIPTIKRVTYAPKMISEPKLQITPIIPILDNGGLKKLPDIIKPKVEPKIVPLNESDNAEHIVRKFETLFKNSQQMDISQEGARDKLIGFFDNLGELSYKIKNILLNNSEQNKDSLMLSNFFSVASKTKRFFDFGENDNDPHILDRFNYNKKSSVDYDIKDNNFLMKSTDDEKYKKLASIFVTPDTGSNHQMSFPHSFNIKNNQSQDFTKHIDQFNRFFQKDLNNGPSKDTLHAPSVDYGISERMGNSKLLSNADNQSHVEVMFNEYGLGSLSNSKLLGDSRNFDCPTVNRFFKSKTHSYNEKDLGGFDNI